MKKILFSLPAVIFILLACASGKYHLTPEAKAIKDRLDEISDVGKIELMPGTPYHTPAFIFTAPQPGAHVLILGGTHGNEPAGYEAALRLLTELRTTPLKKGKLILIPLANRVADEIYNRRVPVPKGVDRERGNLNRCYPGKPDGYPMEQMAYQIQQLAKENHIDVFIDLHEALRSHLKTDTESRKRGLGQTIIYYPNEPSTWLVMTMLDEINGKITDPNNHFSSLERPIKHSAAWWAGKYLNCAAFTFETARKLPLQQRIRNHLQLVHIVLREKGLL